MIAIRVAAIGKLSKPGLKKVTSSATNDSKNALLEYRDVFLGGGFKKFGIYLRDNLKPGNKIFGPAIIEQMDSTTLLLPGQILKVDEYENLIIENGKE